MNSKELLAIKNLRKQEKDEIIIDIDDRTLHGLNCYSETTMNLVKAGYNIQIWYADGMKNPHIHIKKIPHISELSGDEGRQYRILFFEKYIPKIYWRDEKLNDDQGEIPDYSMANTYEDDYHPIAEENKPHYKYKTLKLLRSEFNKNQLNFCEKNLLFQCSRVPMHNCNPYNPCLVQGNFLFQKIASKLSIHSIADQFGLLPYGGNLRICPFHPDKNPSLSISGELGTFHCFGCQEHGNIIKFYAMLKELKPSFKVLKEKVNQ